MGLRMFKPQTADWLRQELQRGVLCRAALARGLCERDGWHNPGGQPCAASARKALPQLSAQLQLPLPAPVPAFAGPLEALGPVETAAERQLCARLLQAEHPLGPGRAPDARPLYLLEAALGPLGVLSFVAAPLRLGPRDHHLGWDDRTRGARIRHLLSNDRFLLRSGLQVPNLASHALARVYRVRQFGVCPSLRTD